MKDDVLNIEILPDGTIKLTTDAVSGANHKSADELLAFVAKLAGGERTVSKRKEAHGHAHEHGHAYTHGHGH